MSKEKSKITPQPPAKIETKAAKKTPASEFKGSVPRMENPPPRPRGTKK
jgi:hypothetical protein